MHAPSDGKANFSSVRVSKDTVLPKIEREEAGNGVSIPAQSFNLNGSTPQASHGLKW
jgi:hypothetical protein